MIKAIDLLKPGGKIIFVSFHSIEDKIIKFYFKISLQIGQEKINIYRKLIIVDFLFKNKNKAYTATDEEVKNKSKVKICKT